MSDTQQTTRIPNSDGNGVRQPGSPVAQTLHDFVVLMAGLLTGFFWHLYDFISRSSEPNELPNVIIGLGVILGLMIRFLFLVQRRDVPPRTIGWIYMVEVLIFIFGLLMGLFWHWFYTITGGIEVHVIIAMLIAIFTLARYIYFIRPGAE